MQFRHHLYAIGILWIGSLGFSGCSSVPKAGQTELMPTPLSFSLGRAQRMPRFAGKDLTREIPVFLVSGRSLQSEPDGVDPFGTERSKQKDPHLAIGSVRIGPQLDSDQILHATFAEQRVVDPRVELTSIRLIGKKLEHENRIQEWIDKLKSELANTSPRRAIIYVHGYNTHLILNTEFAAELSHLTARDTAVISFEWPSAGNVSGYFKDKGNAIHSTLVFRQMLEGLARRSGLEEIDIIAHSAGNPIVVQALKELRLMNNDLSPEEVQKKYAIRRVVLAAPDMDAMTFFNAVHDRFHEAVVDVAVYTSPTDKALAISSLVFGEARIGRVLGQLKDWEKEVIKQSGIQLVDVTVPEELLGGGLGHSYLHRDPWVSGDITLFLEGKLPKERALHRSADGAFWEFSPNHVEQLTETLDLK